MTGHDGISYRRARRCIDALLLLPIGLALMSCSAATNDGPVQPRTHSYAGQTVTVVIGLDAAAGGTTVGRLLAKHLKLNLAGNPTVVVNNMPGASGLNAHLHVLLKAPGDGTTVYYGPRSSLGELLGLPGFSFKYSQFTPLGGVQIGGLVVYCRTDAVPGGVRGIHDIVATEPLRFGGMAPEHGRMIISTMALDLVGVNYRYISGYPSSGNIRAAIISGEVNAATDAAHAYLNQVVPVLVDEGLALPVFSMPMLNADGELIHNAMVPDVPSLPDVYESLNGSPPAGILWDSIKTLLELDQTMQHVFLGPPDMDPAAADTFRAGLQKAMTSEAFRAEARDILGYVPEPVSYERQARILGATAGVSPEILDYIRSHIEKISRQ